MFILLDEIPQNSDQVKYATLIQIIKQKKKGNVRFVKLESDISEQLNGWKQFLDDSDPNGLMWYARLDHDINKIQSSFQISVYQSICRKCSRTRHLGLFCRQYGQNVHRHSAWAIL